MSAMRRPCTATSCQTRRLERLSPHPFRGQSESGAHHGLTVIVTASEVADWPVSSVATARMECVPALAPFQTNRNGGAGMSLVLSFFSGATEPR